jgi:hypothetical protein
MKRTLNFHPTAQENWGFSALKPLAELKDNQDRILGVLYLTYRNDPVLVPGKPIWAFKRTEVGGWLVENEESEASARAEVLRLLETCTAGKRR